jgi:hypothetical protein
MDSELSRFVDDEEIFFISEAAMGVIYFCCCVILFAGYFQAEGLTLVKVNK